MYWDNIVTSQQLGGIIDLFFVVQTNWLAHIIIPQKDRSLENLSRLAVRALDKDTNRIMCVCLSYLGVDFTNTYHFNLHSCGEVVCSQFWLRGKNEDLIVTIINSLPLHYWEAFQIKLNTSALYTFISHQRLYFGFSCIYKRVKMTKLLYLSEFGHLFCLASLQSVPMITVDYSDQICTSGYILQRLDDSTVGSDIRRDTSGNLIAACFKSAAILDVGDVSVPAMTAHYSNQTFEPTPYYNGV